MAEPKLSIKQMKESIREAGLPTADLLERGDIDARYAEAVARLAEAEQLKTGEKLAKRARTEPAERDWRAKLFVWRGEVDAEPSIQSKDRELGAPTPSITWQGAWLGTDDGTMPTEAALQASPNTFKLKVSKFDEEKIREGSSWAGEPRRNKNDYLGTAEIMEYITMTSFGTDPHEDDEDWGKPDGLGEMKFDKGSYKLDTGNGLEDVKDVEHRWEVRMPAVAAVGTTPFGRFVSLGVIEGGGTERVKDEHGEYNFRHQPRMTLARRYIADDDPRAAWASPAAVLDAVLGEGPLALDEIPAKLPWKVDS